MHYPPIKSNLFIFQTYTHNAIDCITQFTKIFKKKTTLLLKNICHHFIKWLPILCLKS